MGHHSRWFPANQQKKKGYNNSVAKRGADIDTLVWTQMVEHVTENDIGHIVNRAPVFGTIVPATRVPAVRSINVDLSSDVAVSHPTSRHDWDGI